MTLCHKQKLSCNREITSTRSQSRPAVVNKQTKLQMATSSDDGFSFSSFRAKFDVYLATHPDYGRCKSVEDKIKYLLTNDSLREEVSEDSEYNKSTETSSALKEKGNVYYGKKDHKNAIECYTKSIYYSPSNEGIITSVVYANKSAVLFDLRNYSECIEDINRALISGYPEKFRYKIYLRKALCLKQLSQFETAKENFTYVNEYLNKAVNLTEDRKREIEAQIKSNLDLIDELSNNEKQPCTSSSPELLNGENSNLKSASSSIQVDFNAIHGRYIVARDDIPSGSTLFIEKPFASALLAEHYLTHCFFCCRKIITPIPCLHCAQVGFCSETCRDESWNTYHRFECRKLNHLNEIGILYLSLRVLLASNLSEIITDREKFPLIHNDILGAETNGRYDNNSYYSVFHLQTHLEDFSKDECDNFIFYSCHVMWFLEDRIRTESHDFPIILNSDTKYFLTYLLFRQSLQIICNAYAITETTGDDEPTDVYSQQQTRIGVALYPTASLMNHSCKPNILSSFIGDKLIVRCVQDLAKGDQVFNCYGPHYLRMSREERQSSLLKQYKFDCFCDACETENEELDSFKCSYCEGRLQFKLEDKMSTVGSCIDCKKTENCQTKMVKCLEANRLYKDAMKLMELNDYSTALEKLESCLHLRETSLYKRNTEISVVQDQIAKCLSLKGDFTTALKYLKLSLTAVKNKHGGTSVEYGIELIKLTDIQSRIVMDTQVDEIKHKKFRLQVEDLINTCEEGVEILNKAFGEWHPYVKDLKEKKQHFSNIFQI
uniref:Protein-lysine N-methyltransferase SMYD4 n=1 Tax=Strigamia maritima TaxID=126957 RepID=T1IUA2_STRMM